MSRFSFHLNMGQGFLIFELTVHFVSYTFICIVVALKYKGSLQTKDKPKVNPNSVTIKNP